jgi:hypothetical protein
MTWTGVVETSYGYPVVQDAEGEGGDEGKAKPGDEALGRPVIVSIDDPAGCEPGLLEGSAGRSAAAANLAFDIDPWLIGCGEQVRGGTVMLPAQKEAVDVALGQPDGPGSAPGQLVSGHACQGLVLFRVRIPRARLSRACPGRRSAAVRRHRGGSGSQFP